MSSNARKPLRTKAGPTVGREPRVVGVATRLATADTLLQQQAIPCELLEFRLDHFLNAGEAQWEAAAQRVEAKGIPVIATLRLAAEGGKWEEPDDHRWPIIQQACAQCSCVDVELQSPLWRRAVEEACANNAIVIVSHHNFQQTPARSDLERIVEQVDIDGPVIIKVAAHVNGVEDVDRLRDFLDAYQGPHPLCLLGMGAKGMATRVEFPRRGSCLTYGHLDESTAPGQLSCQELAAQCRIPS